MASALAALAPNIGFLIAARAIQGAGGAMIMPLSLTLLSAAVKPERRNAALGIWGAIGGAAIALGPLVGGAVTTGWSWHYIFWLNVPIGIVLVPLAWWKLAESRGAQTRLDLRGALLVSGGLLGVVLGLVRGNASGWTSTSVLASFVLGAVLLAAFVRWELRATRADAQPADVPQPRLRRDQRDRVAVQLRDVRHRLLPLAVPPDRPGLLAARRGTAGPALDRHADAARAGRRNPRPASRRQAARRHRPDPAGHQPDVAGADPHRRRPPTRTWSRRSSSPASA